ncbi:hypothetical protein GCM10027443_08560 [Pontibacter brevis]
MKKQTSFLMIAALLAGTACSSTDSTTTADATAVNTSETVTSAGDAPTSNTEATTESNLDTGTDIATDVASALMNMDDATFLQTAASSNLLEIELGNLAIQNASSPEVKEFGRMMVEHHKKANQELQTIASQTGVTLPESLMPMHQTLAERVTGKTGTEFDEDYMDTMETAHKMDVAMFKAKSENASAPNVKSFASKTLPLLESHHKKASDLEDKVD